MKDVSIKVEWVSMEEEEEENENREGVVWWRDTHSKKKKKCIYVYSVRRERKEVRGGTRPHVHSITRDHFIPQLPRGGLRFV